MTNFQFRMRAAAEILATAPGEVKSRLAGAVTRELLVADIYDDPHIPQHFRDELAAILRELSSREWTKPYKSDRVRATLNPMSLQRAASFAVRIWKLYMAMEEFERSGPTNQPRAKAEASST